MHNNPPSPRQQRHPSLHLNQHAIQELLSAPPTPAHGGEKYAGKDWRKIEVKEVVDSELVRWVETDTSVEEATSTLISAGPPNVILVRESKSSNQPVTTFDYTDLNAYLLLVVGLNRPSEEQHTSLYEEIVHKGREGKPIPVGDLKQISRKEPLVTLNESATLAEAVEIFAGGVHRILIVGDDAKTPGVVGVLTQLRMVKFFWENGRSFPGIEPLYSRTLSDLSLGSQEVKAINGDRPLTEALELMNRESITSVPVLDNHKNVVGNISHVDVRLLTKSTSLPLLHSPSIHFISIILSSRGMNDGKDSFPVFYVSPHSSLAHTLAKLVATRSHRMWVVQDPESPASSSTPAPSTPAVANAPPHVGEGSGPGPRSPRGGSFSSLSGFQAPVPAGGSTTPPPSHAHHSRTSSRSNPPSNTNTNTNTNANTTGSGSGSGSDSGSTHQHPPPPSSSPSPPSSLKGLALHPPSSSSPPPGHLPSHPPPPTDGPPYTTATTAVPAATLPGQHISGRLAGVVSLTDVLNLIGRMEGVRGVTREGVGSAREGRRERAGSFR
ncbi:MAG: cell separation during budding [Alyxoria varia]|nr:MAG: cell separation during budding [Alyxoria varia]